MKLISCDGCGVLLDAEKLPFSVYDSEGLPKDNCVWDGERFLAVVNCPVCNDEIAYQGGEV